MENTKTKYIAKVAILSALATVVMFIETPIPFMPPFLKLDLSELIVLLGAFAMGPVAGILIELIKNLVHVAFTITGGIGELANFIVGCAFVVPAAIIYKRNKNIKTAIIGLIVGSISMVIISTFMNYLVIIPLYIKIFAEQFGMTFDQSLQSIVESGAQKNSGIIDFKTLILFGIVPFNAIKVIIISILTFITYKKVSPILHK
ncbi:MAG: ECF transporter S component [Clostridiaceae bacterium]|nr:ECF transporter S component [Clostridiaceae bacterium]